MPETWKLTSTSLKSDGEAEKALVEGHILLGLLCTLSTKT